MNRPESALDPRALQEAAAELYPEVEALAQSIPYEPKGILFSEILYMGACLRLLRPRRLFESGRARGQSTLLLARLFPDLPLISVEHDPDSPDASIALERLKEHTQVDLRFGNSCVLLPQMAGPEDCVFIDGPKSFRALRLALRLLQRNQVRAVFVHDMMPGSPERHFLNRYLEDHHFSDWPSHLNLARPLDRTADPDRPDSGFSLAFLEPGRLKSPRQRAQLLWAGFRTHALRRWNRIRCSGAPA